MRNILKTSLLLLSITILGSCALKPITTQYVYVEYDVDNIELDKLGNGTILIYNGADGLHKIDNTARLNVWIDNIPMGQVRASEYAIINLETNDYEFNLLHIDLAKMRSIHKVRIDATTKIIRIEPTITSNKLTVTNQLPNRFDKFKNAKVR